MSKRFMSCMMIGLALAGAHCATAAFAQNSSICVSDQSQQQAAPRVLANSSWTFQPGEEPRTYKLHDLIHVEATIATNFSSDGKIDSKKTGFKDLQLPNWIKFYGSNLGADGQPNGTPHARVTFDNKVQAEGNLQEKDSLTISVECHVVDIRSNGNLLLEGQTHVKNNDEDWEYSLSGEARPADIQGNTNLVTGDRLADLKITKREFGTVRDSYKRGWLAVWLDKWAPF